MKPLMISSLCLSLAALSSGAFASDPHFCQGQRDTEVCSIRGTRYARGFGATCAEAQAQARRLYREAFDNRRCGGSGDPNTWNGCDQEGAQVSAWVECRAGGARIGGRSATQGVGGLITR